MELLIIILVLILLQYNYFGIRVGAARMKYNIEAPAISGHPVFERHYRVQQNTLEQLLVFVPVYLAFAIMAERLDWPGYEIASGVGVLWMIGRFVYASSYVEDPAKRSTGFMIGFIATLILLIGTLVAAVMGMLA
ncbi:MAG: hypothetical protein CMP91_00695 [Gammaproteobacteria bacterium]|nr:hypothetical protein [Gammaproteobacteria bacterium]|tara:strand:- start:107522 stop:107926 length:405 start_codon:yes stop_codon:yes gene_type:complete